MASPREFPCGLLSNAHAIPGKMFHCLVTIGNEIKKISGKEIAAVPSKFLPADFFPR